MGYFTVAVTFSSKDAADSFCNDLECMYEKEGYEENMVVSITHFETEN